MMTRPEPADVTVSFFQRLDAIGPVLRYVVGESPLRATFEVRGDTPRWISIDVADDAVRIHALQVAVSSPVRVAAAAEVWVDVLSGRKTAGEAFGRRELLLRGSASELARLIPLLELAPPLFRDHLDTMRASPRQEGFTMFVYHGPWATLWGKSQAAAGRLADTVLDRAAFWTGYSLGLLRHRGLQRAALMELLSSASRGWERAEQSSPRTPESTS